MILTIVPERLSTLAGYYRNLPVKRLPFLDWTRGLAVLIMIECHSFNSFCRMDLRQGGPYMLSQFIGGMAAVLFLFLAGVTFAFQMDKLDRQRAPVRARLASLLRRAGYILVIAFLFRITNSLFSLPNPPWKVLLKVDILNCMAAAMAVLALVTLCAPAFRVRAAAMAGLAIAALSPLASVGDWSGVPTLVRDYLVAGHGRFAFFPWGAYLAFGVAAGTVLRRTTEDALERRMLWTLGGGFGLIFTAQYFANIPYSVYTKSDFWMDSPALVIIRLGVTLVMLAAAYLWTEFAAGPRWSWMQSLGKTSLMVYWVHVLLVYNWVNPLRKSLSIGQTAAATLAVMGLMLALSEIKLRWWARRSRLPLKPLLAR
jgi:uncharacterized membrane protein